METNMLRSSILLLLGTLVTVSGSNLAQAIPMWDGEMATLYATDPFEIDFDRFEVIGIDTTDFRFAGTRVVQGDTVKVYMNGSR